jgi:uncharacterized membrane protein
MTQINQAMRNLDHVGRQSLANTRQADRPAKTTIAPGNEPFPSGAG